MDLASFDFIPLREGTAIPSFRCKDPDLNGFLFDERGRWLSEGKKSVFDDDIGREEDCTYNQKDERRFFDVAVYLHKTFPRIFRSETKP